MLFVVKNKKVFVVDPTTGKCRITVADLNEISEFTLEVFPLFPDAVPAWFRYQVDYDDFTAEATTEDVELFEMPPGALIHAIKLKHSVAFGGGGISAYTLSAGITGNLTKFLTAVDVAAAVADLTYYTQLPTGDAPVGGGHALPTSFRVAATATGNDLDQATAGSAEVWVLMSRVATPA